MQPKVDPLEYTVIWFGHIDLIRVPEMFENESSVPRNGHSCNFNYLGHILIDHLAGGFLMRLFKGFGLV